MGPSSRLKVTAALRNTHRIQKNKNSAAFHDQPHKEKLNFPTSSLRLVSDTWIQQQQHTHTHTHTQKGRELRKISSEDEEDETQNTIMSKKNKKLPPCVKARVDNGEGRLYLPGVLMEGGKKGAVWFHRRHAFMSSKDKKKKKREKKSRLTMTCPCILAVSIRLFSFMFALLRSDTKRVNLQTSSVEPASACQRCVPATSQPRPPSPPPPPLLLSSSSPPLLLGSEPVHKWVGLQPKRKNNVGLSSDRDVFRSLLFPRMRSSKSHGRRDN